MQIIQWLSKVAHEPQRVTNSSSITKKQETKNQKVESSHIVVFKDCGIRRRHLNYKVDQSKLKYGKLNLFYFLQSKDASKACFYQTLNLKRLGCFQRKQQNCVHSAHMRKEEKADSSTHVGNRVIPVTDPTQLSSSSNDKVQRTNVEDKEKTRRDKMKAISKMKELLKWAAAAKAEKGGGKKVLHFRNRTALKAEPCDDQFRDDSPKISFSSSAISVNSTPLKVRDQCVDGRGNWITTDSEFVVLEL